MQDDLGPEPVLPGADDKPPMKQKHTKKERRQNPSTRIHSLKKLLRNPSLPSNIRQDRERELEALLHSQQKNTASKSDKKMLSKYHYVRFLERRKAEKLLKNLRKRIADLEAKTRTNRGEEMLSGDNSTRESDSDEATSTTMTDLKSKAHEAEVSLNYALYAPLGEKYISVFVDSSDGDTGDGTTSKPQMWYRIEEAMEGGKDALEALRDGKSTPVEVLDTTKPRNAVRQKASNLPKEPELESDDGDSSDGFFE